VFWYPSASQWNTCGGVPLQVRPQGAKPWFGMFANDSTYPSGQHVVALPDRMSFAVVCDGGSYRVNARDPHESWEVLSVVTRPPLVLAELELVLFVDFSSILAWGPNGLAWDTGDLVYDDLEIISHNGFILTLEGSSPPLHTRRFHVDLRTGGSNDRPLDGVSIPLPRADQAPDCAPNQ
jgi:hypothetical protein